VNEIAKVLNLTETNIADQLFDNSLNIFNLK
jgi:hypothetical protein